MFVCVGAFFHEDSCQSISGRCEEGNDDKTGEEAGTEKAEAEAEAEAEDRSEVELEAKEATEMLGCF